MIVYPAIDLMGGKAVRLRRGHRNEVTVYGDPLEIAASFREAGAQWLHLVDLDAAFDGKSRSLKLLGEIVQAFQGKVELGGGLRTLEDIEKRFALGVERCIIGTAACDNPQLVAQACTRWPGRIAVGIDARDGKVAVRGWVETSEMTAVELAVRMRGLGVSHAIYTDVSRDGMMSGPNIAASQLLSSMSGLQVVVSGGVSSLGNLRLIRQAGCAGAILGKALYEKAFTLSEALAAAEEV